MRSMVKDSIHGPLILSLCFGMIYLGYLAWDHSTWSDSGRAEIINQHYKNIAKLEEDKINIDSIILGGSNSFFSLSASQLTYGTNVNWYNASIMNEGFKDSHNQLFIKDLFKNHKSDIKNIYYSSIYFYKTGVIKNRQIREFSILGKTNFNFKPNISLLAFFDSLFTSTSKTNKPYPLQTNYGDWNFKNYDCGVFPRNDIVFERENIDVAANAIYLNIKFFLQHFESANFNIVFPSEYYDNSNYQRKINYDEQLIQKIKYLIDTKRQFDLSKVNFLIQPPFNQESMMCDAKGHANEVGRKWRTNNLKNLVSGRSQIDSS
jgi:hypothetical protein